MSLGTIRAVRLAVLRAVLAAAVGFAVLSVQGCYKWPESHWGTPGVVRIAYLGNIYTLNPIIAFGQRLIDLTQLYAQPLVGITPDNKAMPVLCTEVPSQSNGGISSDGLVITYHLRHVRFADGVPFTANDVIFTYHAIIDPRNPVTEAAPYQRIASIAAPDRHTVVVRLKRRWAGAVRELFAASDYVYGILPAHAFSGTDVTKAQWNERPFGTGPFMVKRWVRGDSVEFVRNPYAWSRPKLRSVIVKMVADENTAYIALLAHSVDFTDITYEQVPQASSKPDVRVVQIPRNEVDDVEFQTQSPAVRDANVRRAIAYAIDRPEIARAVYHGYSPLATTEIPPLFPEHEGSIGVWPYDPALARELLAGRRVAVRIAFNAPEGTYRAVATVLQADLRAVGIQASIDGVPPSVLYAPPAQRGVLYDGLFDLEVGGWYGGLDPETSEPWLCANRAPSGPNVARWCDRTYDAAYALQESTLDPLNRAAAFNVMQTQIHELVPATFLVYRTEFEAINPSLRGFAPNMLYNFGQTQDWSLH